MIEEENHPMNNWEIYLLISRAVHYESQQVKTFLLEVLEWQHSEATRILVDLEDRVRKLEKNT
jgi:hypothetical protein